MARSHDLLAALMKSQVGGFLATPPGLDGEPGLGIAGISGVPRARLWDATASAGCPELTGDTVSFVVLADGTVVVEEDVPDGSLEPLADAVEAMLDPPYRAAALRSGGDVWVCVAERIRLVELPELEGDVVDLTVVGGTRTLSVDGEPTIRPLPALDALCDEHGDVALHAERVDGNIFAADVFPL